MMIIDIECCMGRSNWVIELNYPITQLPNYIFFNTSRAAL